jgi:hypothetical protein
LPKVTKSPKWRKFAQSIHPVKVIQRLEGSHWKSFIYTNVNENFK